MEAQITEPGNAAPASEVGFLRLPMVVKWTGLGRSTIYRLIALNRFPVPVRLGERAVAWRRADIDRWSRDRSDSFTVRKVTDDTAHEPRKR